MTMYWIIITFKVVNYLTKTFGNRMGAGLLDVAKRATTKRNYELEFLAEEFKVCAGVEAEARGGGNHRRCWLGWTSMHPSPLGEACSPPPPQLALLPSAAWLVC